MNINPIRNSADHDAAVARIGELWESTPGSDAFAELDAIVTLVDAYESRLVAIPAAKPADILRYAIAEMGHTQAELGRLLGSRSRASEVLSGKRDITLDMIRIIHRAWNIPVALLVGEDALEPA
jgi:HTH-type transcriptional regulator/antitoxin HigA